MTLIIVTGGLGSGKTNLVTANALDKSKKGFDIWSNYSIMCENYHYLTPIDLLKVKKNSVIGIDEAYNWLESRTSSKGTARYLSYILYQSRKRNLEIWLTCQMISSIDVRFRTMADIIVGASKKADGFRYEFFIASDKGYKKRIMKIPMYVAEKEIWPFYDTNEIIDPLDRELADMAITDRAGLMPEIDTIVKEMLVIARPKAWTKGAIADYCLENGYGKVYEELIYNRIKRREAGLLPENLLEH